MTPAMIKLLDWLADQPARSVEYQAEDGHSDYHLHIPGFGQIHKMPVRRLRDTGLVSLEWREDPGGGRHWVKVALIDEDEL